LQNVKTRVYVAEDANISSSLSQHNSQYTHLTVRTSNLTEAKLMKHEKHEAIEQRLHHYLSTSSPPNKSPPVTAVTTVTTPGPLTKTVTTSTTRVTHTSANTVTSKSKKYDPGEDGPILSLPTDSTTKSRRQLRKSKRKQHSSSSTTSNKTQEITDLYPGFRVEAFRALFGLKTSPADLFNMAINMLFQEPAMARSYHLEEFALGNRTKFIETTTNMFEFLLHSPSSVSPNQWKFPLCTCVTVPRAVRAIEDRIFVTASQLKDSNKGHSSHITHGFLSTEQRAHYMKRLTDDKILGPILHLLAGIIDRPASIAAEL
jgi:hypothetical protein